MRTITLLAIFFLVSLNISAQTGFLNLTSEPSSSRVILDGKYIGLTPISLLRVPVGDHSVEIFYKDYETQIIDVKIIEDQVTKQNIILVKSGGFKVKPQETSTLNQAKGALTIITNPDNSKITVNGIPVEQKTPVTISEIGAGDQLIGISNFVYINGQYKEYSIERSVHIRPNKTELLEVDFNDFFGSAEIKSAPTNAKVFIDNNEVGNTPAKIDNLSIGDHTLLVEANLSSKPYFGTYKLVDDFKVEPKMSTKIYIDFYNKLKTGDLQIRSNNDNITLSFTNLSYNSRFQLNPGYNDKLVIGNYSVEWLNAGKVPGEYSRDKFGFNLEGNKNYLLYIPVKNSLFELNTIDKVEGYIPKEKFLSSNYTPLPETKQKTVWRFDDPAHVGMGTIVVGGFSAAMFVGAFGQEFGDSPGMRVGLGIAGIGLAIWAVAIIFEKDYKTIKLLNNIKINNNNYSLFENEYKKLEKSWEQKLLETNQPINEKNTEIKKYNESLPPASISVIK